MSRLFFPNNSSQWAFDWNAILQAGGKRYLLLSVSKKTNDTGSIFGVELRLENYIGFNDVWVNFKYGNGGVSNEISVSTGNGNFTPSEYTIITKEHVYENNMGNFLKENPNLLTQVHYEEYKKINLKVREEFKKFENNVVLFDSWKFDEDFHAGKVPPKFLIDVLKNILFVVDFSNPGLEYDEEHLAETIQYADVLYPQMNSANPTGEDASDLMYMLRWFLMVYTHEFETNRIKWGLSDKKIEFHHHQKTLKEIPKPKVKAKTEKIKKMKSCARNVNPRLVQQRDNLKARIAKYNETLAKQKETIKKLSEKL